MRKLIWIFLLLFEPMANAGGLSPVEANIAQNISTKSQEQLSLLERLVNINSGTTNLGEFSR